MKQFIKRIFGIDKILAEKEQAQLETAKAKQEEAQAKLNPKERATARGEPYVAVLDTKVNLDNVRNGFFELDWNEEFVLQLKKAGYGFDGDPEEEIVDRWFRDLARNMLVDEGLDPNRGAGYINVTKLPGGKAQVE